MGKLTEQTSLSPILPTDILYVVSDPGGTPVSKKGAAGTLFTSPTITTPIIVGAITFPDNTRQTFNPGAAVSGFNVGSHTADPSTPTNGDLWYATDSNALRARINGATVSLGAGGGGFADPMTTAGDIIVRNAANSTVRLAKGTALQVLRVNAGATELEYTTLAGGGNAQTADPLSQFAATTSAQLRGVLSDELGTGAALFDGATPTSFVLTNATGLPLSTGVTGDLPDANLSANIPLLNAANVFTAVQNILFDGIGKLVIDSYSDVSATQGPEFQGRRARGSLASPTAVLDGDTIARFGARGYAATAFAIINRAEILMTASENWTDSAMGTRIAFKTVFPGALSVQEICRVDHDGLTLMATVGATPDTGRINFQDDDGSNKIMLTAAAVVSTDYRIVLPAASSTGFLFGTNTANVNDLTFVATVPVANGGTGITSFGTGVATWLGTPSSANLRAALSDELGTGAALFDGATPTGFVLTNATGLPPTTGITGWPANASGVLTNDGAGVLSWGAAGAGDMVLASVQTVTGAKQFGTIGGAVGKLILAGATSGSTILNSAAVAGSLTLTLPAAPAASNSPILVSTAGVMSYPTGTPDGTKFLRDDGSWAAGGGGSQTPWTADVDADSFSLLFDDATGIKSSETGNPELLLFTSVASAVNELSITNAATGNPPVLSATGDDTDISIALTPKGAGAVRVNIAGTASAPSLIWEAGTGFYLSGAGQVSWATAGSRRYAFSSDALYITSDAIPIIIGSGFDTSLSRISAGLFGLGTGSQGSFAGSLKATSYIAGGVNGQAMTINSVSELITLSTSGATTDSTADLLPADAIILFVTYRITTSIAGVNSTALQLGDPTTATRFGSGATLTANATIVGKNHLQGGVATDAAGPIQVSAAKVRLTLSGGADNTPSAGVVRVTTHYISGAAPTS